MPEETSEILFGSSSHWLLVASIVALAVGPLFHEFARQARVAIAAVDGLVFVAVGALVLFEVLPRSFMVAGLPALLAVLLGLAGPYFLERSSDRLAKAGHFLPLLVAVVGVILHAAFDGMALAPIDVLDPAREVHAAGDGAPATHHEHDTGYGLALAVLLHRLPVGFAVWYLIKPTYGIRWATSGLGLMAVSTVAGFQLGATYLGGLQHSGVALFQALVGGSLLHVLLHRPHERKARDAQAGTRRMAGVIGGAVGLGLLLLVPHGHEPGAYGAGEYSSALLRITLRSAPALLVGYLMAGLLAVFIAQKSVTWLGRGRSLSQAMRGMAYGIPLPICSCGVVPIYRSLVQRGVPATAAMAFLIATPELGVDSLMLSWPLLGGELAFARVVCAVLVALLVGWIVGRRVHIAAPTHEESAEDSPPSAPPRRLGRLRRAVRTGLVDVLDDTAPWIIAGLAIAAALEPAALQNWLVYIPPGTDVIFFALVGMPLYICASGATPLAAVLLFKGVSPGAVIALLLTGPATNITTFGILSRLHGRATAVSFATAVAAVSVALGYAVNWTLPDVEAVRPPSAGHHGTPWIGWACLSILAVATIASMLRQGLRGFVGVLFTPPGSEDDDDCHGGGSKPAHPAEEECCRSNDA